MSEKTVEQHHGRHSVRKSAPISAAPAIHRFRRRLETIIAGMLMVFGIGSLAHAIPVTLEFAVSGLPPTFAGIAAPTDPVSGMIVYQAAALGSPIESLTSISLNVGNHSFSVDEVSFISQPGEISTSDLIGGSLNGPGGVTTHTSDFSLQYDRSEPSGAGANFVYASSDLFGIWRSTNFTSFSLSAGVEPPPTSVPEPGTLSLLVLGLLMGVPLMRPLRNNITVVS
jgi:hypothetical protein